MSVDFSPLSVIPEETQALLIDCDGTIADTMAIHHRAWIHTLRKYDLEVSVAILEEYSGVPTLQIAELLSKRFSRELPVEKLAEERDSTATALLVDIKPIGPVLEIIDHYFQRLPMAVISGGTNVHVMATLEQVQLHNRFQLILTADSPFPPKPNPDLFLEAARTFGVQPHYCVVLEDGAAGLQAAERAGMQAIDVRTFPTYLVDTVINE